MNTLYDARKSLSNKLSRAANHANVGPGRNIQNQLALKAGGYVSLKDKIAALISPLDHYVINVQSGGSNQKAIDCLRVDEYNVPYMNILFSDEVPKKGDMIKLDLFEPGVATVVNYGVHELPVRDVRSRICMLEVVVDMDDVKRDEN